MVCFSFLEGDGFETSKLRSALVEGDLDLFFIAISNWSAEVTCLFHMLASVTFLAQMLLKLYILLFLNNIV